MDGTETGRRQNAGKGAAVNPTLRHKKAKDGDPRMYGRVGGATPGGAPSGHRQVKVIGPYSPENGLPSGALIAVGSCSGAASCAAGLLPVTLSTKVLNIRLGSPGSR